MTNRAKIRLMKMDELANFLVSQGVSVDGESGYDAIYAWLKKSDNPGRMYETVARDARPFPLAKEMLVEKYGSVNKACIALNLPHSNVYNVLNGKMSPYPKYIKIISEGLGVDEHILFPKETKE